MQCAQLQQCCPAVCVQSLAQTKGTSSEGRGPSDTVAPASHVPIPLAVRLSGHVCMCAHAHTRTCTCTHMHTHMPTHMYTHARTCTHTQACALPPLRTSSRMHVYTRAHTHTGGQQRPVHCQPPGRCCGGQVLHHYHCALLAYGGPGLHKVRGAACAVTGAAGAATSAAVAGAAAAHAGAATARLVCCVQQVQQELSWPSSEARRVPAQTHTHTTYTALLDTPVPPTRVCAGCWCATSRTWTPAARR